MNRVKRTALEHRAFDPIERSRIRILRAPGLARNWTLLDPGFQVGSAADVAADIAADVVVAVAVAVVVVVVAVFAACTECQIT